MVPTKACDSQADLSLAYTPGVAEPCREIARSPELSFEYTARGNLVAVVTNGTRVLGLRNIGALAGKPVMEGKAVLFKRFGDVDVFDLEVNSEKAKDVIKFCQLLEPTVGGINLEDIKTPECFVAYRVSAALHFGILFGLLVRKALNPDWRERKVRAVRRPIEQILQQQSAFVARTPARRSFLTLLTEEKDALRSGSEVH